MSRLFDYHPLSPEVLENPYPYYQKIREHTPLYWNEELDVWMVMRYHDIVKIYKDKRASCYRMQHLLKNKIPSESLSETKELSQLLSNWMLFNDPPRHTCLRSPVNSLLTNNVSIKLKNFIHTQTEQLIEGITEHQFDLHREIARPLSFRVMAYLFGLKESDFKYIQHCNNGIVSFLGLPEVNMEQAKVANQDAKKIQNYFRELIQERSKNLSDDLISRLITQKTKGAVFGEEELIGAASILFVGSQNTPAYMIDNGIIALIQNRNQMKLLQRNPHLIESAIEEILRYNSPTQSNMRLAKEDIDVLGITIKRGQGIMLVLGSGNHDSEIFLEPSKFDIQRSESNHLSFGYGIHFCIGATIARLIGSIAIPAILRKWPNLRLGNDEIEWRKDIEVRGPETLLVYDDT